MTSEDKNWSGDDEALVDDEFNLGFEDSSDAIISNREEGGKDEDGEGEDDEDEDEDEDEDDDL